MQVPMPFLELDLTRGAYETRDLASTGNAKVVEHGLALGDRRPAVQVGSDSRNRVGWPFFEHAGHSRPHLVLHTVRLEVLAATCAHVCR